MGRWSAQGGLSDEPEMMRDNLTEQQVCVSVLLLFFFDPKTIRHCFELPIGARKRPTTYIFKRNFSHARSLDTLTQAEQEDFHLQARALEERVRTVFSHFFVRRVGVRDSTQSRSLS